MFARPLAPRELTIAAKLSLSASAVVACLFALFILFIGYSSTRTAETQAAKEIADKTALLTRSVEILDRDLTGQVAIFSKVFRNTLDPVFTADPTTTIDIAGLATPVLRSGQAQVNLNFSIPDRFTQLTGVYATVFVRAGDDFVRVTTSHKKENGERAVGTKLDHAHPGYAALLSGEPYSGSAALFGGHYMTRYEPITDTGGKVIGATYVGINFTDAMLSLANGIKNIKPGGSGEFYAINAAEGKDLGKVLISQSNEGKMMLGVKDAAGREYVREMLQRKQGHFRYLEAGKEGAAARERVVAFSFVPAWQMLLAGDVYLDEITAPARHQRNVEALFGFVLALGVAALLYTLISKMIGKQLAYVVKVAEAVAAGDLSPRIEVRSADEIGRLMLAMKNMTESLSSIVAQVRYGTDSILTAATEIAVGNDDLSGRTEQQAASLEETASSVEQLTATVQQNSDNAYRANQLAMSAANVALEGGAVVSRVVSTMESISESSSEIVDIIAVIDRIAFQTNILALNAAVEAARAGEQGRSFAVVADEVRTLAQNSAAAAKEIKHLINKSVRNVEDGAKLVDEAGGAMQAIVESTRRVTAIIGEMSIASMEQTAGINQINKAILQVDQVTQQNAALAQQASAAAQSMRHDASELARAVHVFHISGTGQACSISSAPAGGQTGTRLALS